MSDNKKLKPKKLITNSTVMKKFFVRLAVYFASVAAIDLVVDYLYNKSFETTILGGDIRSITIMFLTVLVGTILLTIYERMKRAEEKAG